LEKKKREMGGQKRATVKANAKDQTRNIHLEETANAKKKEEFGAC